MLIYNHDNSGRTLKANNLYLTMSTHDKLQRDIAIIVYRNAHFSGIADDFHTDGQILGMRTGPGLEFEQVVKKVCEYVEEEYGIESELLEEEAKCIEA